jgi:hypothetical protein
MTMAYRHDPDTVPVKVRDLREGDMVDLQEPNSRLSHELLAEFEYGVVGEIDSERERPLILVDFENIGTAAYDPDDTLYMVARGRGKPGE